MNTTTPYIHLPLTPIIHPWVTQFLTLRNTLQQTLQAKGSPLNIHCLRPFEQNMRSYQAVLDRYGIKHRIYFARKANKCLAFANCAAQLGQGVDTASYRELQQCLAIGIPASQLICTAAVKNRKLLELAVGHGVSIVLDNMDEYNLLNEVVADSGRDATVVVRVGGFDKPQNQGRLFSRFGFLPREARRLIVQLEQENRIHYSGLHFHLNGYSVAERVLAIEQSLALSDELAALGIKTPTLDIGGGYLVNYLQNKQELDAFVNELKRAVLGQRPPLTFQNDGLGILNIDEQLYGGPQVYPYYNELSKERFLEAILNSRSTLYGEPIHRLISDRGIELRMEPGRSLLDQAGMTVASVAFRKYDTEGNLLVGLEMNRTQLRSSSADFLLDPIHLTAETEDTLGAQEPHYGYLVGAYCLEQELILKRKIKFLRFPQVGDIVVFPNTAGYMMHFFESEAHLFELAKNLVFDPDKNHLEEDNAIALH